MNRLILGMCLSEIALSHLIWSFKNKCLVGVMCGQIFFAREGMYTELAL